VYTSYTFGWGGQENGYYLSFVGACRVVVLIVVLPLLIKLFHKQPPLPKTPRPDAALVDFDSAGDGRLTPEQKEWEKEAKWLRVVHDSREPPMLLPCVLVCSNLAPSHSRIADFDLLLARISILIDILGYTLFALNHGSPLHFLLASVFSSFGGGAGPAIQSLALAHASPRDAGRLFASLSVLQSVAAQVVGPLLFGAVFIWSVPDYPEAIFWVAVGLFGLALGAMLCVKLRRRGGDEEELGGVEEDGAGGAQVSRGRSATRKPTTSSGGDSGIML
jgi:hypothetical protein